MSIQAFSSLQSCSFCLLKCSLQASTSDVMSCHYEACSTHWFTLQCAEVRETVTGSRVFDRAWHTNTDCTCLMCKQTRFSARSSRCWETNINEMLCSTMFCTNRRTFFSGSARGVSIELWHSSRTTQLALLLSLRYSLGTSALLLTHNTFYHTADLPPPTLAPRFAWALFTIT